MTNPLISIILFLPLLAGLVFAFIPSDFKKVFQWGTIGVFSIQLVLTLFMWFGFDGSKIPTSWESNFQMVEKVEWIRASFGGLGMLNVDYHVGIDGVSALMVLLSSLILLIGAVSSFGIKEKIKGYFILYLIMGASIIGCFVALDFFLFYVFFEFMLLPMFFLIGIWGGARRQYASVKFFIYTLIGSLFILIAMVGLYLATEQDGLSTFNMLAMISNNSFVEGSILTSSGELMLMGLSYRAWFFWLLIIGFLIKLPAVPFHTWLPDAHVEAPTAISVVLAGLLLKIGGYGIYRLGYSIFPDQAQVYAQSIAVFGIIAIIYGGLVAMAQTDLKRLVAYSSVSHMGFVLVGLAALTYHGVSGAIFQMFSHGLLSPALFLIVGVLYDRTGNRHIENFSGLGNKLPKYTFLVGLFFFASLGLPGLSGFVGEVLVLLGAFSSDAFSGWVGPVAVVGILVSAAYFLWTLQRMFFGDYWVREDKWKVHMKDLTMREWVMLLPLAILAILFGLFPSLLLNPIQNTIEFWVNHLISSPA